MKKTITLAALILCAGLTLTACSTIRDLTGIDLFGSQDDDIEQNTTTSDSYPEITSTTDDSETTSDTTTGETTEGNSAAEGGNSDFASYIEVTVSEDKYFYENHEISYDDLIEVMDGLDENTAVRISDENAALNAFEALTDALEERGILYEVLS